MDRPAFPCPVPEEQQPLKEYEALKKSWFFKWALFPLPQFIKPMIWIWSLGWFLSGPVAAASFDPAKDPFRFFLVGATGAGFPLGLLLIQLYCGWLYVGNRLRQPQVSYEESGWFDGQVWQKPPEVMAQDQLIMTYEVRPFLQRLEQTFGIIGLGLLGEAIVWQFL
jgi:hypothetical protein